MNNKDKIIIIKNLLVQNKNKKQLIIQMNNKDKIKNKNRLIKI